jgi:hypothetical protein
VSASYLAMVTADISRSQAELISAAADGDEGAFKTLVGPLIEPGYKLATVMLRDSEEARDVVQEACLIAWRKLVNLRTEGGLRPWFLAIVANLWSSWQACITKDNGHPIEWLVTIRRSPTRRITRRRPRHGYCRGRPRCH